MQTTVQRRVGHRFAESESDTLLAWLHHLQAGQASQRQHPNGEQKRKPTGEQTPAPRPGDIKAELEVDGLLDRTHQVVRCGQQAEQTRIKRCPWRFTRNPRPVEPEHEVQDDFCRQHKLEDGHHPGHGFRGHVVAQVPQSSGSSNDEQQQRVAGGPCRTAAKISPHRLLGHACGKAAEDERHHGKTDADRHRPAQVGRDIKFSFAHADLTQDVQMKPAQSTQTQSEDQR